MRPPPIETWPEWAHYAAEELSGSWYLYENKPRWNELCGEWTAEGQRQIVPRISVSAKDSLIVRP